MISLCSNNLKESLFLKHELVSRTYFKKSLIMLRDRNTEESWALLEDLTLYDNESWNDPRDFAKPVKAISLPQDVPSTSDQGCESGRTRIGSGRVAFFDTPTSDRRLIELENQVQHLMEAHLAPKQPIQVNKITSSCEICSDSHNTQYCMENLEQAFVDYASLRTDKAGGKWYTFKPEENNLGDTYNPSWKSHPNLSSINVITICPKRPGEFQYGKPEEEEQEEKDSPKNINTNSSLPPDPSVSFIPKKVRKLNSFFESLGLVPQSSDTGFFCTKGDDGDVMFIKIIKKNDDSYKEEPKVGENAGVGELEVDYFDIFPTRRNFIYAIDFIIVEDISSIIDPRLSQVVLGKPFVEISNMTHDPPEGVVRNEEDKRRGVEYVMSKILGFYKECLELGPEYLTGFTDEGEVT
ncbi:hypothetical protein Tco_1410134 [Tanacetum coccineum]